MTHHGLNAAVVTILLVLSSLVSPAFAQLDSDSFESYAVGSTIAGQGSWDTWDQAAGVDSVVVDTFNSTTGGVNSLELQDNDDIVRLFNGLNQGQFEFTSNVYVPSGQAGTYYFILLNTYEHNGPKNWSVQIEMSDATGLVTDAGGSSAITGLSTPTQLRYDQWIEIRVVVDIDNNLYSAYYAGTEIMRENVWQVGGSNQMRCLDLYNGSGGTFYYDDVYVDVLGGCGNCCPFDTLNCVSDCVTDTVDLSWTSFQPGPYSQGITVIRDGVDIATLPGNATSYQDIGVDDGVHNYEIVGLCTATTSWSSSCSLIHCSAIDNDTCDTALPITLGIPTDFDTTFALLDPSAPAFSCGNGGSVDQWYTFTPPCDSVFNISLCGSSYDTAFEVFDAGPTPGNCAGMTLIECNDDSCGFQSALNLTAFVGTTYLLRISGFGGDRGPGTILIDVSPITGLTGFYDCLSGFVEIAWDGAGIGPTYDEYEVFKDGVSLASGLPSGTTFFTDTSPVPGSAFYEVVGTSTNCGLSSAPTGLALTVPDINATDIIFRVENVAGAVDSAGALSDALTATGRLPLIVEGQPENAPCGLLDPGTSAIERIWYCGGTFPNNAAMSVGSSLAIADAQFLGIGIYVEAGDAWGFDPVDPSFGAIDGVADGIFDGDDTFLAMNGLDSTFGLDLSPYVAVDYIQDAGAGNDWTDQLVASTTDSLGPDAAPIWEESLSTYSTGVYYSTNAGGKVICQSWEFGGFTGDRDALVELYATAMAGGGGGPTLPEFRRGDSNGDGGFNIADAVFLLAGLFSGGPASACADASDANDDGGVNIADAIYKLATLFSGGPALPTPGSVDCGPDPTDTDALDCASYNCP